jgi:hypothetical protein
MNVLNRLFIFAGVLGASSLVYADFDQIIIGDGQGTVQERTVEQYDRSLSKFDGGSDEANPYLGKVMHRTFDCSFSPQRDHSLFVKRSREGVEFYKERGATRSNNTYDTFRTMTRYLSGDSYGEGGQPVIAMFTKTRQIFLVYRIYETKDGRSTLLCYYNSDGRVGHGGTGFAERLFSLKGYKKRSGFVITEGSDSAPNMSISLIEPANIFTDDAVGTMAQGVSNAQNTMGIMDGMMGTGGSSSDSDWEMNPPHPDNIGVSEGQVGKKVEGKTDILSSIMEPLMFGAKIGVGAYMLKEALKPQKKDDDDDYSDWGYGYGMDYGMGGMGGSMYGNGAIMGGGMMNPGMYPGGMMYPGMYLGGQMPYGQMPYGQMGYPGAYPGQMPGYPAGQMPQTYTMPMQGDYPGAYPMTGNQYPMDTGNYPGNQPMTGGYPQTGYPQTGYPQTGYPQQETSYPGMNPVGYDPIQAYVPAGGNMYPVPGNSAPMAASSSYSSANPYGLNMAITQNDNTFLNTSGY